MLILTTVQPPVPNELPGESWSVGPVICRLCPRGNCLLEFPCARGRGNFLWLSHRIRIALASFSSRNRHTGCDGGTVSRGAAGERDPDSPSSTVTCRFPAVCSPE